VCQFPSGKSGERSEQFNSTFDEIVDKGGDVSQPIGGDVLDRVSYLIIYWVAIVSRDLQFQHGWFG
jgi:hypothetical protein